MRHLFGEKRKFLEEEKQIFNIENKKTVIFKKIKTNEKQKNKKFVVSNCKQTIDGFVEWKRTKKREKSSKFQCKKKITVFKSKKIGKSKIAKKKLW